MPCALDCPAPRPRQRQSQRGRRRARARSGRDPVRRRTRRMTTPALRLATVATLVAAVVVPLVYLPMLEAPFLVPKFAVLDLTAALGLLAYIAQAQAQAQGGTPSGI